jgi:hypothetical protein
MSAKASRQKVLGSRTEGTSVQCCSPGLKPTSRAGGVADVVEHLPSKSEALSSNPSTTKNKQTKTPGKLT